MSRETRDRVWEQSRMGGSALVLLLQMAERADVDGVCFPGMELLMARCRRGDTAIKEALRETVACGELYAPDVRGAGRESVYFVTVGLRADQIEAVLIARFGLQLQHASRIAERMTQAMLPHGEDDEKTAPKINRKELDPGRVTCRQKVRESAPLDIEKMIEKKVPESAPLEPESEPEKGADFRPKKVRKIDQKGADFRRSPVPPNKEEPSLTVSEPSVVVRETLSESDSATADLPQDSPRDSRGDFSPNENHPNGALQVELQAAIVEACGKTSDWQFGHVSSKFQIGVRQLTAKLVRDQRTVQNVQDVRARLPAFLGRDPTRFTPPSPNQLLDVFDAVLSFDPEQNSKISNQNHGSHHRQSQRLSPRNANNEAAAQRFLARKGINLAE